MVKRSTSLRKRRRGRAGAMHVRNGGGAKTTVVAQTKLDLDLAAAYSS